MNTPARPLRNTPGPGKPRYLHESRPAGQLADKFLAKCKCPFSPLPRQGSGFLPSSEVPIRAQLALRAAICNDVSCWGNTQLSIAPRPDETHRLPLDGRNFTAIEVAEVQTIPWIIVAVIVVAVIAYNTVDDPFNIDPE